MSCVFFFPLVVLAFVSTRIFCCSVCFVSFTPIQIHVILEVKSASPFYLFRLSKVIINELWCLIPPIDYILSKESNTLTLNWPLPVCMGRERKGFWKKVFFKNFTSPRPQMFQKSTCFKGRNIYINIKLFFTYTHRDGIEVKFPFLQKCWFSLLTYAPKIVGGTVTYLRDFTTFQHWKKLKRHSRTNLFVVLS